MAQLRVVIFGLSITSSWGNGHATTYRSLVRELSARGHDVLFLERDAPWYADNRDLPNPPYGSTMLYSSVEEVKDRFARLVRQADVTIVGSYVPDGVAIGEWVMSHAGGITAFYDIDTPVTMAKLERGEEDYLSCQLISQYDLYLSFTGGPLLRRVEKRFGSPRARLLHCSVDPIAYYPEEHPPKWDLGYIGTYGEDRQPTLEALMCEPARQWHNGRFVVAGPQYPVSIQWPANVARIEHLPPSQHRYFYNSQRFTLNITRADMVRAGYSPSVRLFEAAACGVPIISDEWRGLSSLFRPGKEILTARSPEQVRRLLQETPESQRLKIGKAARARVLAAHTSAHRAEELERHVMDAIAATRALSKPRRLNLSTVSVQ
jgi:spore maturation protein CgeB